MNKLIVKLLVITFAMFSPSAFAQIYATQAYCNGAWVTGSCNGGYPVQSGYVVQQQQVVTQPILVQQALQSGSGVLNGLNECKVVGGIAGGTVGSLAKHHTVQATILGILAGGVAGNAICNNSEGQQVLVRSVPQEQQVVVQQTARCAHDPGTKEGVLNLPRHPKNGQIVCAKPGDANISLWL